MALGWLQDKAARYAELPPPAVFADATPEELSPEKIEAMRALGYVP